MEVERTFEQWSVGSPRIRWSAIFAGWAVGLAVQMLLTLLGLGFGAWAVDFQESNGGISLGAGIWTGASMLISAFIGGYVTARLAGSYVRSDGMYHGIVVWGVNWLIFAWLITTAMATMIGGVFSVFGTTLQTVTQGVSGVASTAASKLGGTVSISVDDLKQQVESVLNATDKPELQPGTVGKDAERVTGAAKSGQPIGQVSDSALAELKGKLAALDRNAAINILVNKFGMSNAQANEVVQSTIGVLAPLKDTMEDVKQRSAAVGTEALDRMGTVALWLAVLSLITLGVSALGGLFGTPNRRMLETAAQGESYRPDLRRAG